MTMSASLIDKILENNQLIKGRLSYKKTDLEKLYRSLEKDNESLEKKSAHQEKIIKSNIIKRNEINSLIKKNSESLQKSFYPSTNKISLLHKKQGEFYYLKARFYWRGKQREVQVGSIPNVIKIINSIISNNLVIGKKINRLKNISWEQINKRPILIEIIKEISSLKAQEYLLRRLIKENLNDNDENVHKNEQIQLDRRAVTDSDIKYEPIIEKEGESIEGIEWYKKWRRDNL